MSENNFEQFQPKVCDATPEPLPLKKLCPTCTPNKSFIAPDWKQMLDTTYLDEATCEYRICVTINNEGEWFTPSEMQDLIGKSKYPTRDHLFRSFVQPAIRLMLQDTDKLIAQQIICASYDGPAITGRTPNELLQEYDNFNDIFMKLEDAPLSEAKDCPDLVTNTVFGASSFEPGQPMSFNQFVLNNTSVEIKNPFALELYARVIDFDIEPMQNMLKVLVSIPAFILEAVPDTPTAQEIQESAMTTKKEVEIDVKKFFGLIFRLKASLSVYSKYQSHFYQTQDGFLKFKDNGKDYYASSFSSKIEAFYSDLKAEANSSTKPRKKRWNLRSNTPSVVVKNAEKIRITFMDGDDGNPYRIKRIDAKIEGCEYQRICGRNSKFAKKYSLKPTVMNYIAKIDEIDIALKARESYPWLDFLVKFTYPLLVVDYGVLNEESVKDTMGECVADNIQDFGGELKDYILNEALSLVESIAYEFNSKESCQELSAKSEIEKKYFEKNPTPGLDAKKDSRKEVKADEDKAVEKEKNTLNAEIDSLKEKDRLLSLSYDAITGLLETRESDALDFELNKPEDSQRTDAQKEEGKAIKSDIKSYLKQLEELEKQKTKVAKELTKVRTRFNQINSDFGDGSLSRNGKKQLRKNAARRARKASKKEGNPYWKEAKKLALEELKDQNGILSTMVDFEVFMNTGKITSPKADTLEDGEPEKLLNRLTLCNVQSLTINAIQCLFSGVTQEAAFKKMVEAALNAMDVDVMGFFIQALPPNKQFELRKMAKDKWANMPMPWEEGYVGGSTEKANPYLVYLGTNNKDRSVNGRVEALKMEQDKINRDIALTNAAISSDQEFIDADAAAKAANAAALAKEEVNKTIEYTIKKGDTLGELSIKYLKDFHRWREIMIQNSIPDEKKLVIGSVITITLDEKEPKATATPTASAGDVQSKKSSIALQEQRLIKIQEELKALSEDLGEFPLDEDGKPLPFSSLSEERQAELIAAQKSAQGTFGTALGDIQSQIINMYIENMLDVVGVDELMSTLDRFPGGALVQRYINQVGCSFQGLNNPPVKSFLSTLSFDPCGEGNTGLSVPSKMRDYDFKKLIPWKKDFMKMIRNKFIEKLETVMVQIMVKMILKLIKTIDDAICKTLNATGQFATGLISGNSQGLDEAFRDAFCPDADDNDLDQIKRNAFNSALGKGGNDVLGAPNVEAYDCLFQTMNATMSKQEVIGLLTNTPSNMDSGVITRMSQLVKSTCPDLAPVFGDPEDIKQTFCVMQRFIPTELRIFLKEQATQQPEGPIFDSICLTQAELEKWNEDRRLIYASNGMDVEMINELIDKANDRALKDLGTVAEMMQKGPEGLLAEALDDLLRQKDPACVSDPSAIVLEDEDLAAEKLDMINDFFKVIEKKFISDLIEGKHSILNNILIDTRGNRFSVHQRRAGRPFQRPNYVDNEEMLERRKEEALFQVDLKIPGTGVDFSFPHDLDRIKGTFPETVGGRLLQKMEEMNLQYDSKAKNTIVMNFIDHEDHPDYKSKLIYRALPRANPTHLVKVDETFYRTVSREEKKKLDLEDADFGSVESINSSRFNIKNFTAEGMTNEIDYNVYKDNFNVETVLFRNFLMKKSNITIPNSRLGKLEKITDAWNLDTLNFVRKSIIKKPNGKIPVGFKFGSDDQQKITFKDLLYVNPESDPENKLTWFYTKFPWDKVLGKSATEHPRVHFLDPSVHGGSYLFPKIYIEPATYNGWMGMIKTFIPEMEVCDEVDNGFLRINEISRRAKEIEGKLPIDPRLSAAPECRFEVPYDRQLTPANHGLLEGIVLSTVRTFGTEFVMRVMPILGSIRLTHENYDDSFFVMMAQKMEQEFIGEEGRIDWNMVKSYTYYLLFLEQSVQVAQRQIKDGLMIETEEMKVAAQKINKVQMNFPTKMKSPRGLEMTIKGASIIGHNAEWEDYFILFEPSEYRDRLRWMLPHRRKMAQKVAAIHESKVHAQVFLAALLKKEMSNLTKTIEQNLRPLPHIWDIKKFVLSEDGPLKYSKIKSGRSSVEANVMEGSDKSSYGTIIDCPDSNLLSHTMNDPSLIVSAPKEGIMFLEKYVRTINKDMSEQVMTVSEFRETITNASIFDQNKKISDYFGDPIIIAGEFRGTIGVKFGVRLIYVPHESLNIVSNLDEAKERVGKFGIFHHIPLAHYEHDVLDQVIKNIDFEDENMGEELKCFVDNLALTDDFKLIFETIIKTTTFSSLFGIYSYYNFFESIGQGTDEVEEARKKKINGKWKRKVFDKTKTILKKQFRSTYRSDDDQFEDSKREKRQFDAEWVGNLLPDSYLGLDGSVRWWQSWRIVSTNPFGQDGEDCLNDFQKIFKD